MELARRKLIKSRTAAANLIMAGQVVVEGVVAKKASQSVTSASKIELLSHPRFASRGGEKLSAALDAFSIKPDGLVTLDVGASTGGFTDCLLKRGARKIYAVDVGSGQLAAELQTNPKVVSLEQTDIRTINSLPEKADLAVVDVSFISLNLVLPHLKRFVKANGQVIALVKPQFESAPEVKNRRGVVTKARDRDKAIGKVIRNAPANGFAVCGSFPSPIAGGAGNWETFLLLKPNSITD